jgi:hypothetical protein
LKLLPLNKDFDHNYTHLIARFCYSNETLFDDFLSWLRNKHTFMKSDIISKWNSHWSKLNKFPPVDETRIKTILHFYYPHLKKDTHYRNFAQTFHLPEENKVFIERIDQNCFDSNEKYSIFNVGMGGGKTAQTITYLQTSDSFLWIAPNKALANNTIQRLNDEHIEVFDYLKAKTKDKEQGSLNKENKLIIVLNSIHYIQEINYEVLVVDEIETLIDKFMGDFMEQGAKNLKKSIWSNFVRLIRNAKKGYSIGCFYNDKNNQFNQINGFR